MVLCRGASPPYPHWGLRPQTPAISAYEVGASPKGAPQFGAYCIIFFVFWELTQ